MINRLNGIIIEKNPPSVVIDIAGLGYEIEVSMQTFYNLPSINERIVLYIQAIYREDSQQLFGFINKAEKNIFNQLIKVNGIGAKIALAILSALSINDLVNAIETKNIVRLSSVPGIGKKTAERMALELKDKLQLSEQTAPAAATHDIADDIIKTLLALGYNQKEAVNATQGIPLEISIGEAVKLALKNLTK